MVRTSTIVETAPEPVLTNLLPIANLPANIAFFEHQEDSAKIAAELKSTGIPHAPFHQLVVSFAEMSTIQNSLPPSLSLKVRSRIPFTAFLDGAVRDVTSPQRDEARKIATSLLRQHVERYLEQRGLKRFETSSGPSFYFPSGLIPNDKVPYVAASGRKTNRNVVGRSERNKVNWHLAMKVNVALGPPAIVRFKPYVCFSEDGLTAVNDSRRTSAIRRRFCRNWWNQHWRQLQETFCVFLAAEKEAVAISLDGSGTPRTGRAPAARSWRPARDRTGASFTRRQPRRPRFRRRCERGGGCPERSRAGACDGMDRAALAVVVLFARVPPLDSPFDRILHGARTVIADADPPEPEAGESIGSETWLAPWRGAPHPLSDIEQRLAAILSDDTELAALFCFNWFVDTVRGSRPKVDLVWIDGRLVVELDGYPDHATRRAFIGDRHRDYELAPAAIPCCGSPTTKSCRILGARSRKSATSCACAGRK
jgi:hypothetical protein